VQLVLVNFPAQPIDEQLWVRNAENLNTEPITGVLHSLPHRRQDLKKNQPVRFTKSQIVRVTTEAKRKEEVQELRQQLIDIYTAVINEGSDDAIECAYHEPYQTDIVKQFHPRPAELALLATVIVGLSARSIRRNSRDELLCLAYLLQVNMDIIRRQIHDMESRCSDRPA